MGKEAASRAAFFKCWQTWKLFIAFRNVGQGKRCRICASLDQERSQATSQAETADVIHRKKIHLVKVKQDRRLDVRTSFTAEQNAKHLNADGEGQVLKLSIDGMDQATPCQGFACSCFNCIQICSKQGTHNSCDNGSQHPFFRKKKMAASILATNLPISPPYPNTDACTGKIQSTPQFAAQCRLGQTTSSTTTCVLVIAWGYGEF